MGKVNRSKLMEEEGVSRPTLSKKLKLFLDKPLSPESVWKLLPPRLTKDDDQPWVLGIDGKWLRRKGVVMIYRDITHKENLFWSYRPSESYEALHADLQALVNLPGFYPPSGVISDWKGSIVASVSNFLPHSPHQRCLTHVVGEVKRLLPRSSGILGVSALRKIAFLLTKVKTQTEKRSFLTELIGWEKTYGHLLTAKTINPNSGDGGKRWWYTHGNLRRAFRLLTDDWNPFFIHLDHLLIPSTNNSLEGLNSQIKKRLSAHRGMKTQQQISFLFWYLSFTRTKTKQDLKKLWGGWKRRHN